MKKSDGRLRCRHWAEGRPIVLTRKPALALHASTMLSLLNRSMDQSEKSSLITLGER